MVRIDSLAGKEDYRVRLQAFEGPLDLLLHLIESQELDIYDVPIARITDQYLTYVRESMEFRLEVASEFLLMAAQLLVIKARSLLPSHGPKEVQVAYGLDAEYVDDERELRERLIEYRAFKLAGQSLGGQSLLRAERLGRLPLPLESFREERAVSDFLAGVEALHLRDSLARVLARAKIDLDVRIVRDRETVAHRMRLIEHQVRTAPTTFFQLLRQRRRREIVTVFLAVLELIRLNRIVCRQEAQFEDIWIIANTVNAANAANSTRRG